MKSQSVSFAFLEPSDDLQLDKLLLLFQHMEIVEEGNIKQDNSYKNSYESSEIKFSSSASFKVLFTVRLPGLTAGPSGPTV